MLTFKAPQSPQYIIDRVHPYTKRHALRSSTQDFVPQTHFKTHGDLADL